MISPAEIESAAATFGAPVAQIERDHLISHVLAALPQSENLVFFGGTALCRTWLPGLRLSEDIDLLVDDLRDTETLRRTVSRQIQRDFPNPTWISVSSQHDVDTWMLVTGNIEVKVQFALWRHQWQDAVPVVKQHVELRYTDLPATVEMLVPTGPGFAAMKIMAWTDRHAPRDLYDLAALAEAGLVNTEAHAIVKLLAGHTPTANSIGNVPLKKVEAGWADELGHQGANTRTPTDCLKVVRDALNG